MAYLTDEEREILSDAGLFYDISSTRYDYDLSGASISPAEKKKSSLHLSVLTSYEPVFSFLKHIYIESPTARISSNLILEGVNKNTTEPGKKGTLAERTCIILLHGFKSQNKKIYIQLGRRFARQGVDAVVYTLPFHFERRYLDPEGKDVLGMQDFRATLEFFRQTVIELRILIRILKKIGYRSVGVLGFSFGGYCCNLLASFDKSVDFIVPMASIGEFDNLLKFKKGKAALDPGDSKDRLNDFFSTNYLDLICPINYKPVINIGSILFIQGLFDRRAPYREVQKLRKKWGNPKTIWFPCDHATFFLYNRITLMLTVRFIRLLKD